MMKFLKSAGNSILLQGWMIILILLHIDVITSSAQSPCASEEKRLEWLDAHPDHRKAFNFVEQQLLEKAQERVLTESSIPYTIPVVLHIVTPPGTPVGTGNNLSENQIDQGLQYLNDIFANQTPFVSPEGIDTEISFCLAKRDPQNRPTPGYTRTESQLVNEMQCNPGTSQNSDRAIKNLVAWDCRQYMNVWLVTDLFGAGAGCGLAGFAYFPGAGCDVDGIIVESRYWYTQRGVSIIAHEVGHYLGLYHTFQGGCGNNDCLMDGDRVCDTPPDNSNAFAPCGTNSCNTDNPDLPDDTENIMDYSNCQPMHFTQGQTDRMQNVLAGVRNSLVTNNACDPVVDFDLSLRQLQNVGGICSDSICPILSIKNSGIETIVDANFRIRVDAGMWMMYNWNGNLATNQGETIFFPCIFAIPGTHNIEVDLVDVNGRIDQNSNNNRQELTIDLIGEMEIQVVNIKPAKCASNGGVEFNIIGGDAPYSFALERGRPLQTNPVFNLLTLGDYQVTVTDNNGCVDSLMINIPDSCAKDTPRDFVLNGDARYNGNTCYTITRDRRSLVGSIWYEDLITLEEDFIVSFEMNLGVRDGSGADGIAFVFQPISTTLGILGGGIGYQGISPSLDVEFDTWQNNGFNDPAYDHLSIMRNGTITHGTAGNLMGPVGIIPSRGNVEDGNWRNVIIKWDQKDQRLSVRVDCDLRISWEGDVIDDIFGNDPFVYFGFTAATGGSTNVHQVCINYINATDRLLGDTICMGESIQKSAPSVFSNYQWTPNIGISDATVFNPIFSPDTTTTYYVRMSDQCIDVVDSFVIEVVDTGIDTILTSPDSCGQLGNEIVIVPEQFLPGMEYSVDGITYSSDPNFVVGEGTFTAFMRLGRCLATKIFSTSRTPELADSLIFQRPETCDELGQFIIQAVKGTPPYEYSIDMINWKNDGMFPALNSGLYQYFIKDAKGCMIVGEIFISDFTTDLKMAVESSDLRIDCCDSDNFIEVVSLGQGVLYSLDGGPFDWIRRFENLSEGAHFIYATSEYDCPSDTLHFIIEKYEAVDTSIVASICQGSQIIIAGKSYNSDGFFYDTIPGRFCCDTTYQIEINVDPVITSTLNYRICHGEFIQVGSNNYDQTGTYRDTFQSLDGCDSVIISEIIVNEVFEYANQYKICPGSPLDVGHRILDSEGLFIDTLESQYQCDSILISEVTLLPSDSTYLTFAECKGFALQIGSEEYSQTGIYQADFQNSAGCDSIVFLDLTIYQDFNVQLSESICPGEVIILEGLEIADTGFYSFDYQTEFGCDSIIEYKVDYAVKSYCDSLVKIYVPNVFSPNGDNLNDRFTIYGSEQLEEVLILQIFDRWGEQVFQDENFPPNNAAFGWDGTFKDERLPPDVFVYKADLLLRSGEKKQVSGDVTLIR